MNRINIVYENAIYKKEAGHELGIDIYVPAKIVENMPAVVFFHGGYWKYGDKSELPSKKYGMLVSVLNSYGITVASVDYRLLDDDTGVEDQIKDCKDGIKWLVENSHRFSIDSRRIALWGTSAGAHLAMMAAFTAADMPVTGIKTIVSYYGPSDLTGLFFKDGEESFDRLKNDPEASPYLSQLLKMDIAACSFEAVSEKLAGISPVNFLSPSSPGIFLVHGYDDTVVPINQSIMLKDACEAVGIEAELLVCENTGHGFEGAQIEDIKKILNKTADHLKKVFNIS